MPQYPLIESRATFGIGLSAKYMVRTWRKETEIKAEYEWRDLYLAAEAAYAECQLKHKVKSAIAEAVAACDRITAVEVCDNTSHGSEGIIIYREWP